MAMTTRRRVFFDRSTFSWTSVLAGVVAALIVHVLLVMLGLGIGLLSVDTSTVATSPVGVSWSAFLYWAISGIIAAFVGGWVAGSVSPAGTGGAHGLAAASLGQCDGGLAADRRSRCGKHPSFRGKLCCFSAPGGEGVKFCRGGACHPGRKLRVTFFPSIGQPTRR